jgi:hypothetical protein
MNKPSAGDESFCGYAGDVDATASNHQGVTFDQGCLVFLPAQVHRQCLAAFAASNDNGIV